MENGNILLSICIPTYNRIEFLLELVSNCLSFKSEQLEIVITDNCSSDGTIKALKKITDSRLRVVERSQPVAAYANMIDSIYQAQGKYAFYCNDRDLIFADKLQDLIDFLSKDTYSFVYLERNHPGLYGVSRFFETPYTSLMNHDYIHHPTGMVFNRDMMEKYPREKYYQFVEALYTNDFLMMDLLRDGKSAIFNLNAWSERPREFKLVNRSGAMKPRKIYLDPEVRLVILKAILQHINKEYRNVIPNKDLQKLYFRILLFFLHVFPEYKTIMLNKYEMNHYGLDTQFLSTSKMMKYGLKFYNDCLEAISELPDTENVITKYKGYRNRFLFYIVYRSIRTDFAFVYHKLKEIMCVGD